MVHQILDVVWQNKALPVVGITDMSILLATTAAVFQLVQNSHQITHITLVMAFLSRMNSLNTMQMPVTVCCVDQIAHPPEWDPMLQMQMVCACHTAHTADGRFTIGSECGM
jgi:hypothetical protein